MPLGVWGLGFAVLGFIGLGYRGLGSPFRVVWFSGFSTSFAEVGAYCNYDGRLFLKDSGCRVMAVLGFRMRGFRV